MKNRVSKYTISDTAIKYISLFESFTNTKVKDCLPSNEKVIFVLEETQAGKAIGRHGSNIKRLEGLIKKKIKVIEFNADICQFIRNVLYPLEIKDMNIENNIVLISGKDMHTNGIIIGRDGRNLDFLTSLVKRYFDVERIRIER